MHIPESYWTEYISVFSIPDFTCDPSYAISYFESSGEQVCNCNGSDYKGMPPITLIFDGKPVELTMEPENYMFLPYLNYTTLESKCVLAINGPTTMVEAESKALSTNVVVLG